MQYRKNRNGDDLSILGYGCMRFTRKESRERAACRLPRRGQLL